MKRPFTKSLSCALRGIITGIKTERNLKIDLAALIIAVGLGMYLELSVTQWCLVIFAAGFVLTAEMLNTSLERWCDEATGGKQSETIRNIKDIAAAAVLVAAITALIIGIMVLVIPLIQRVF